MAAPALLAEPAAGVRTADTPKPPLGQPAKRKTIARF